MSWNPLAAFSDIGNGNYGTALLDAGTFGGYSAVKGAYEAPFEEKRRGFDAVSAAAEQVKQERIARKQAALQASLGAMEPTREAIRAVYGDPTTWKL